LSEDAHHHLDLKSYKYLIAASDNSAYNALVCTEFGPEIGRGNVFQIGTHREEKDHKLMHFTLGGRPLFKPGLEFSDLRLKTYQGWGFNATELSDSFDFEAFKASRPEGTHLLLWQKSGGDIVMASQANGQEPESGDKIFSFGIKPKRTKQAQDEEDAS
jgi:hypothetical protein